MSTAPEALPPPPPPPPPPPLVRSAAPTPASGDDGGVVAELGVLGMCMKEQIDIINRLRNSGALQNLKNMPPLPRIAVVGNQSAGKSSLIEAISGIRVPRQAGTCTRCPLEISLRTPMDPAEGWSCRVILRIEKELRPRAGARPGVNPWVAAKTTHTISFMETKDKNEVEHILRRAQEALLNPSTHWREFADEVKQERAGRSASPSAAASREAGFSPNVVSVEVTGPDLPELSFIDLPGLIRGTDFEEDAYLIHFVEDMVVDYIKQDDCLVLLTISMKDEADTQPVALTKQHGADRVIGALTKPDTIQEGDHAQWLDMLRGRRYRLGHGYFVTKGPNSAQLASGIAHADARKLERAFFDGTRPWCDLLEQHGDRFGTPALAAYASQRLGELIRRRLPEIVARLRAQQAAVDAQLATMPAPPSENRVLLVSNLVRDYEEAVRRFLAEHSSALPDGWKFQDQLTEALKELKNSLAQARPRFEPIADARKQAARAQALRTPAKVRAAAEMPLRPRPRDESPTPAAPGSRKRKAGPPPAMVIGSDDDDGAHADDDLYDSPATPRKAAAVVAGSAAAATPKRPKVAVAGAAATAAAARPNRFTLPDIYHILQSTSTTHLPGQADPAGTAALIRRTLKPWETPIAGFLAGVAARLRAVQEAAFAAVFAPYAASPFADTVRAALHAHTLKVAGHVEGIVLRMYEWEARKVGTFARAEFAKLQERHLDVVRQARRRNLEEQLERAALAQAADEASAAAQAAAQAAAGADLADTPPARRRKPRPLLPARVDEAERADEYLRELKVLAEAAAYHELARTRFVDYLALCLQVELVDQYQDTVRPMLRDELGLDRPDAEDRCRALLIEDPKTEHLRAQLLREKHNLARAMEELERGS